MKRCSLLIVLFIFICPLVFAVTDSLSGTLTSGTVDSVSFDYQYSLSNVNTYKIGFSRIPVENFTILDDADTLTAAENLVIDDGQYTAHLNGESVYVYWQIHSPVECSVTLTAGPMVSGENVLNVELSTIPHSASSDRINIDNGRPLVGYMTTGLGSESGGEIFYFVPDLQNNYQAVGSQQVVINTESFRGRPSETYMGTMTLTITGIN